MKKTASKAAETRAGEPIALAPPTKPTDGQPDPLDQAWIDFFDPNKDGVPEHRYGDLYRMWLINPTVIQMCLAAARRKAGDDDLISMDLGLAVQGQAFLTDLDERFQLDNLEKWHDSLLAHSEKWKPLKNLTILDLGCGVGYLARILTSFGAEYYGLDHSARLIETAKSWWSKECDGRAGFQEFNLDTLPANPVEAAKVLRGYCGNQTPDFILGINVLEYLKTPETLLGAARHLLAPNYATASAFFVAPNPDYYIELGPTNGKSSFSKEPDQIMIACLGRGVPKEHCHLWGRFKISEFLRNCGFVVLQESFLTVPHGGDTQLKSHYRVGSKAVNLGLAPFVGFSAIPLPAPRSASLAELNQLYSQSVLKYVQDATSPLSRDSKLINEIKKRGFVVTLNANKRLLARHNLGGNLFVVLKGQFGERGAPENVFKPNEAFGELEVNYSIEPGGMRYGYYVNETVALKDGSEVFVIPTPVATKLVGPGSSLHADLFAKLREKVILRNARRTLRAFSDQPLHKVSSIWREFSQGPMLNGPSDDASRFFFPVSPNNPYGKIAPFGKYELGRVAGALIELQEIEHRKFCRLLRAICW